MSQDLAVNITPITDSPPAPDWVRLQLDLRKWMSGWIDEAAHRHEGRPWRNLHDEGIFTRTFPAFYLLSGHEPARGFSEKLADEFLGSPVAEACTCFLTECDAAPYGDNKLVEKYHGYQADQSCLVHGPENYCWFLAHLAHVSSDPKYAEALRDCAEHIGNFSDDCPPWYDWDNHRFRSALIATKRVRDYPPYDYETLTHVRVMVLATNTYALTGDSRYLDLAVDWCDKWADVVLDATGGFRVALYPVDDSQVGELYGEFANTHTTTVQYELAHLMLDLHRVSPHERYAAAVRKMIDESIDKGEWGMGILLAKYRAVTGDTSFDAKALAIADGYMQFDDQTPALVIVIDREGKTGFQDVDYIRIADDKSVSRDDRSAGMLACAYAISGDERYAQSAMRLAWMRFWAGWYLWDGRELGCRGSWTGRNGVALHNVIPALNLPATGGFGMVEGEVPWMEVYYRREDDSQGLPKNVAALHFASPGGRRTIKLANTNPDPRTVLIKPGRSEITPPKPSDPGWVKVEVPGKSLAVVEM